MLRLRLSSPVEYMVSQRRGVAGPQALLAPSLVEKKSLGVLNLFAKPTVPDAFPSCEVFVDVG